MKYKVIRRGLVEQQKVVEADNERIAVDREVGNDEGWETGPTRTGWTYQTVPVEEE
ncbi:hypothetical protein SEA_LEOPARD_91 [Mycobacterium phage Leopard]|nr:hypothetical protein SEA_LEOPARD_91 [Mycobacterium phage Leopard]